MTDNAWAYRWSLRKVCADHGDIKQVFIKPHCPWQNGKAQLASFHLRAESSVDLHVKASSVPS